jgi:sodium-coupled neutral amino acid transporter 11
MVAFCVIVGDTIPRVLDSLFPSLSDMSFLWLLTNRKAVMIVLILGISFPLSLYRDISKVNHPNQFLANTFANIHHSSQKPAVLP